MRKLIIDIIQVVRKKDKTPDISNSGKTISTNHKIPILITILKKPRVRILTGKAIFFKIGLIKALSAPKTKPHKTKTSIGPSNFTPGRYFSAIHKPKTATTI